jgi:hypothetical protein
MQAIVTKTIPATTHKGTRIKATAQAGSIYLGWDHALDRIGNYRLAACRLAEKWGWVGHWAPGALPDGNYVWVEGTGIHRDGFEVREAA